MNNNQQDRRVSKDEDRTERIMKIGGETVELRRASVVQPGRRFDAAMPTGVLGLLFTTGLCQEKR